jgi:hypothetical protein
MAKNVDLLSKQLQELSKTINSFKSEAVQLKIVDKLLTGISTSEEAASPAKQVKTNVAVVKPKIQPKPKATKEKPKAELKADKKAPAKPVIKDALVKKLVVKAGEVIQVEKKVVAKKGKVVSKSTKPSIITKPVVADKAKKAVVKKVAKVTKPQDKAKKVSKVKKDNGPTSTINSLFETGYFTTKRNMGEVVKYINVELKRPYKMTALSGLVNKLVKDKKLVRAINPANKKFEYVNA